MQRARHEEVLLQEPQNLSVFGLVVGVQNLRNGFAHGLFVDCLRVAALVECPEVEFVGSARFPEAQEVHRLCPEPDDRHVPRHADYFLGALPGGAPVSLVVHAVFDAPAHRDFHGVFGADDLPRAAEPQPVVWRLHLPAVFKRLREEPELVAYAVADGGVAERCKGVLEACGEPSEAAVAKPHVDFGVKYHIGVKPEFAERLAGGLHQVGVDENVGGEPAHEVFEGKVVHPARVVFMLAVHRVDKPVHDVVFYGERRGDPPRVGRGGLSRAAERTLQVPENGLLHAVAVFVHVKRAVVRVGVVVFCDFHFTA